MDFSAKLNQSEALISAYGDAGFTIGGQRYEGSVLLLPDQIIAWDGGPLEQGPLEAMKPYGAAIELLIIGCGEATELIPSAVRQSFKAQGIAIEAMDTGAACRTYNILLSESRHVAAALVAV